MGDVAVAEGQAEGIVIRGLEDRSASVYDRADIAKMVGEVVLRYLTN